MAGKNRSRYARTPVSAALEDQRFDRKNMTSTASSSTSSIYTSTDDARRYSTNGKRDFFNSDDIGTTRLLRSYSDRGGTKGFFAKFRPKPHIGAKRVIIIVGAITALILTIIIAVSLSGKNKTDEDLIPPDPEYVQPSSWSKLRIYKRGAVCADSAPCSIIGKNILEKNGSAVDATLAAVICNGLVNMQSLGIGGGFMMTIYERSTGRSFVLNARDRAPLAANSTMYEGMPPEASHLGALAAAVPGELAGYWEAHQKFGKLQWAELFQPSIELCESGYNMTKAQYDGLLQNEKSIYKDATLRKLFVDSETKKLLKPGSIVRPKVLCKTLRIIAEKGAAVLYNGTIGQLLVEDLQKMGGIITMQDLNEYRTTWDEPIKANLSDGTKVFTVGLPGSGALLAFILNVFDNCHFTPNSLANINSTILTYHRMIETFKYAYALRTSMGDKDFVNMTQLIKNITSKEYAISVREKITDERTWNDPQHYGASISGIEDHGTAHISVLAPNGDAVSVTSTINFYFGSGVVSERTGILLNNAMDDFGVPSKINYFGVPPSPNNYIEPKKRPLSSMVPSIVVDSKGDTKMVIGAAGGTKITTATSQAIAKILWMGQTVKETVDAARIHHQLFPMKVIYEYGVQKQVIDGLKKLGHITSRYRDRGSIVCAISQLNGTIYANADYRKGGDVYGLN